MKGDRGKSVENKNKEDYRPALKQHTPLSCSFCNCCFSTRLSHSAASSFRAARQPYNSQTIPGSINHSVLLPLMWAELQLQCARFVLGGWQSVRCSFDGTVMTIKTLRTLNLTGKARGSRGTFVLPVELNLCDLKLFLLKRQFGTWWHQAL